MAITRLLTISRRLLFTTCITHPPPPLPRPSLAHALQFERCTFTDSAASASENPIKSPLGFVEIYGKWGLTQIAMMCPGMDYEHWDVYLHNEGLKDATKEQIIDCYIKTLAQVVGSEEEAKKKIYKVICDPEFSNSVRFGCQLDWETAYKLEELPQVRCIIADSYRNAETKDYGGELLVNGKIVQRSSE